MLGSSIENPYAYRNNEGQLMPDCSPKRFSWCRLMVIIPAFCICAFLALHFLHFNDESSPQGGKAVHLRKRGENLEPPPIPDAGDVKTPLPQDASLKISPSAEPTQSPTPGSTSEPTPSPTNRPTWSPTVKPTNSPTFAPTLKPIAAAVKAPTPTYYPTYPRPTIAPSVAPTMDSRFKLVWLIAGDGLDYIHSGAPPPPDPQDANAPEAINVPLQYVSDPINCWNSISRLDRLSEDYLNRMLFHRQPAEQQEGLGSLGASPIAYNERLHYIPATFCMNSKQHQQQQQGQGQQQYVVPAHSLTHTALGNVGTITLPIGYSWSLLPRPEDNVDETVLTFNTFFFVFYLNSGGALAPVSSAHHVCFFVDHRSNADGFEPMKLCFFEKQLSLQTPTQEYTLSDLPADERASAHTNAFVIASYRLSRDAITHKLLPTAEMFVIGADEKADGINYSAVAGREHSRNDADALMGMDPLGNVLEFTCTDSSSLYCSSHFLLAETLMFEEKLTDDKVNGVVSYLRDKYKYDNSAPKSQLQQQLEMQQGFSSAVAHNQKLPEELLAEMKRAFEKDSADAASALSQDKATTTEPPKLSCENGNDPFGDAPIDTFVAPEAATTEDKKKWKFEIAKMLSDIASLNVGGAALRTVLDDKVKNLRALRLELFCKYL